MEFSEIEMCKNVAEQILGLIAHSEQFSTAHFPRKEAEKCKEIGAAPQQHYIVGWRDANYQSRDKVDSIY